jgi:hypothetical protein
VVQKDASTLVAQPELVGILRVIRQQGLTQQPDRVSGAQLAIALALLDLATIEVRPAVEDTRRQVAVIE